MPPIIIDGNTIVRIKAQVICIELEKEAVLFNLENFSLYRLNETSALLWKYMIRNRRIADSVSRLVRKCEEINSEYIKGSVFRQIKKFIHEGLIEILE